MVPGVHSRTWKLPYLATSHHQRPGRHSDSREKRRSLGSSWCRLATVGDQAAYVGDIQTFQASIALDAYVPDSDPRANTVHHVTGFTFTPLSQPQHVLAMVSPLGHIGPAVPAQLTEAPRNGGNIDGRQLWILIPWRRRTRALGFSSAEPAGEPAEEGQPWEEVDLESSYCDEARAQIAQAKEQIAGEK